MAGGIAHDFNNLLSGIFGNLDLTRALLAEGDLAEAANTLASAMAVFERARSLTRTSCSPSPQVARPPEKPCRSSRYYAAPSSSP